MNPIYWLLLAAYAGFGVFHFSVANYGMATFSAVYSLWTVTLLVRGYRQ